MAKPVRDVVDCLLYGGHVWNADHRCVWCGLRRTPSKPNRPKPPESAA